MNRLVPGKGKVYRVTGFQLYHAHADVSLKAVQQAAIWRIGFYGSTLALVFSPSSTHAGKMFGATLHPHAVLRFRSWRVWRELMHIALSL